MKNLTLNEVATFAQDIEEVLAGHRASYVAGDLCDIDIPVVPVYGHKAPRAEMEKAPAYRQWTSTNPVDDPMEAEKLCDGYGVAIVPVRSTGLIVIDADTDDEVAALEAFWGDLFNEELPAPTVKTPGKKDGDEWKHSNGGHWYVVLPTDIWDEDKDYASSTSVKVGLNHFDIISEGRYCIVPPTRRSEGRYRLAGHVTDLSTNYEAAEVFAEELERAKPGKVAKTMISEYATYDVADLPSDANAGDRIAAWARMTPWFDLLGAAGWTITDTECGGDCLVAKFPESTSSRSCVAHESTCNRYPGMMSFYSSTAKAALGLADGRGLNKWTFMRDVLCGGDRDKAFHEAGIHRDISEAIQRGKKKSSVSHSKGLKNEKGANSRDGEENASERGSETFSGGSDSEDDFEGGAGDVKFRKALKYAQEHYKCEIVRGGRVMWMKASQPGIYFESADTVKRGIKVNTIPGALIPQVAIDGVIDAMIIAAEAVADDGYGDDISPEPRISPSRVSGEDITYVDTQSNSGVVAIGRGFVRYNDDGENAAFMRTQLLARMPVEECEIRGLMRLWQHVNVPDNKKSLVLAWLVNKLASPKAALPIMMLQGDPGSGKTTTAERLKDLTDPSPQNLTPLPRDAEQTTFSLTIKSTTVFDNISSITRSVSDTLAMASTGAGHAERKLYTDSDYILKDYKRSVIMTCVDTPTIAPDLRSRMVFIQPNPEDVKRNRKRTQQMIEDWEREAPKIRGALFAFAAEVKKQMAIGDYVPVQRLSDFDVVCQAVDDVLKREGLVLDSASESMGGSLTALDIASVPDIVTFMIDCLSKPVEGRPGEILSDLKNLAKERGWGTSTWVNTGAGMVSVLKGNLVALEASGFTVETFKKRGHNCWRLIPNRNSEFDLDDIFEVVA